MRNKYPGQCYRCGGWVRKGEGHFELIPGGGGWRVQHAGCAIKYRGTKQEWKPTGTQKETGHEDST